jgi:hypothetical protein
MPNVKIDATTTQAQSFKRKGGHELFSSEHKALEEAL